jgi:hypothetical protein
MRRFGVALAAAAIAASLAAAPVAATPPTEVTITTTVDLNDPESLGYFTATGLPACESGVAFVIGAHIGGGPSGTVKFNVLKVYLCDGSGAYFLMRIEALLLAGADTNHGDWQIFSPNPHEDSPPGHLDGLRGGGTTVGEYPYGPAGGVVIDHMTGVMHVDP